MAKIKNSCEKEYISHGLDRRGSPPGWVFRRDSACAILERAGPFPTDVLKAGAFPTDELDGRMS